MKDRKVRIDQLSRAHVMAVARLHVMGLSRDFSGWAGRQIISLFYRELIATHDPPPGFVAMVDGRVVGFAVAVADASAIRRRVVRKWPWRLAILAAVQILTSPMRFIGWLRRQFAERRRGARPGAWTHWTGAARRRESSSVVSWLIRPNTCRVRRLR